MTASAWWRDFRFESGAVHVHKTGARIPVDPGIVRESLDWLLFYLRIEGELRRIRRDGPRIWFGPDRPRPWYLIWPAAQLAGLRLASKPEEADIGFAFEDATSGAAPVTGDLPVLNAQCTDVSKTRVSEAFEAVSGRALNVIPEFWRGPMVIKSEANGVHDGRIVQGPCPAETGAVHQRLIDTETPDGCVEDLRCPTVDGEISTVFMKHRPLGRRFSNRNSVVRLVEPSAAFSEAERDLLRRFCRTMGLDWGGLDVLRDRRNGEIWVVDVNKTDMGPPSSLPLNEKMVAVRSLARDLRHACERRIRTTGES